MEWSRAEARRCRYAGRLGALTALLLSSGCANGPHSDDLIDPLKQRLIAREDIAMQKLLFARTATYGSPVGPGGGSYLDAPYDGPAIEPPLPDLSLLSEDLPPWEEKLVPLPPGPEGATPLPSLKSVPPHAPSIPTPETPPTPQP